MNTHLSSLLLAPLRCGGCGEKNKQIGCGLFAGEMVEMGRRTTKEKESSYRGGENQSATTVRLSRERRFFTVISHLSKYEELEVFYSGCFLGKSLQDL